MRFGLEETDIDKINAVFGEYPKIEEAIIYGSRSIGNFRNGSDIDLVLKGELTFDQLLSIETLLDDQLLPYKIDLSLYPKIKDQDLIDHIQKKGALFYQRTALKVEH